ncbi:MAG: hypothetical protein JWM17_243, partial [Actinobacteria bacterium]|nr:hypothetical protein [Actinomycetota bacterium]
MKMKMKMLSHRWWLAEGAVVVVVSAVLGTLAFASSTTGAARAGGLGETTGLLPRDHLTLESAIQVDLRKETVRLPLYRGKANGQTVWYVLLDASDAGLAHDLGVNYAPKLANLAIGCPDCGQTVTLESPTPHRTASGRPWTTSRERQTSALLVSPSQDRMVFRSPPSSPAPAPGPGTAHSFQSQDPRSSTTRPLLRPARVPSTSITTPTR